MIGFVLAAVALVYVDAITSIVVQRRPNIVETGLPSLLWGGKPTPEELVLGATFVSALGGFLAVAFAGPLATFLVGLWAGAEAVMVWMNVRLLRG